MGNTHTGRTCQKTPCSSAERCYFPSSAPEHSSVHCKQHLVLINSASVPTDKLHTICTAFSGRLLFPLIFGLRTQTAMEDFPQVGGKGQETPWPPLHTPTPLLWRNEEETQPRADVEHSTACRQALLWYSTMSSPARCKWMSPMFHPIFQWEGKGSPYKQEQRSCHWVTQQVNKGGERDEVYLKSIIFLQRKSQAFQELLNDELPVSLSKRNNGVGDEKSRVAWLSKDSLALRGNSGQNLSLFGQTQVKENFLKHGMHGMLKPTVHHPVYLLPKQWWHKLPPTNSSICPASKSTKTNKHTKQ